MQKLLAGKEEGKRTRGRLTASWMPNIRHCAGINRYERRIRRIYKRIRHGGK